MRAKTGLKGEVGGGWTVQKRRWERELERRDLAANALGEDFRKSLSVFSMCKMGIRRVTPTGPL